MRKLQKLIQDCVANGKSLRQISAESNVEYTSINNYANRNVEPRGANLGKLAEYFRVPFADLLDDYVPHNPMVILSSRTVPVISQALGGAEGGYFIDAYPVGEGMERIECPADITDPYAFAFRVTGDSMYPRYMEGEYVIVDTTKPVVNGDDVVVKLRDDGVLIKKYTTTGGMVILKSYNQMVEDIPILDGDLIKCFKIVCRK